MRKGRFFVALGIVITAVVFLSLMPSANTPEKGESIAREENENAQHTAESDQRVQEGCSILQTMYFTRCGHSVTRRLAAPREVVGGSFSDVQQRYELWRMDEFFPEHISMSREIELFCPMHQVLMCNEAGEIVCGRNVYGDGMTVEKTYFGRTLDALSPDDRELIRNGLGFDSREQADAWMESH